MRSSDSGNLELKYKMSVLNRHFQVASALTVVDFDMWRKSGTGKKNLNKGANSGLISYRIVLIIYGSENAIKEMDHAFGIFFG